MIRMGMLLHYCPAVPASEGGESVAAGDPARGLGQPFFRFLLTKLYLICLWRGSHTRAFGAGCWATSEDYRIGPPKPTHRQVPARKWQRERADTPMPRESGCGGGYWLQAAGADSAPGRAGRHVAWGGSIPSQLATAAAGRF
jgi:hypothetical protein